MFAPCINSIENTFYCSRDVHYYKIIEMLKQFKIITLAPTCFCSCTNHHQGAVLNLAKTTIMVFLCSSVQTQSMLWRHISLLCRRTFHSGERNCRASVPTSTEKP